MNGKGREMDRECDRVGRDMEIERGNGRWEKGEGREMERVRVRQVET